MAESEGEKRREGILRFLSKPSVYGKELNQAQGSGSLELNSRQESLELASTYRLVEERNIGYSHDTDKQFHSRSARKPNYR